MKMLNLLFLAIWLIASGLITLINLSFNGLGIIMAILQIVAGVFLILGGKKIKVFHELATLLLGIFLIISGVFVLFTINFSAYGIIMGILAIVVAVFLFLGFKGKKLMDNIAPLLLAVYFILHGLSLLIKLSFAGMDIIMAIIAIIAGILLLIKNK
ncbi:MAG TPA: hypothetical protein ENN03_02830 [bacterium]|nr:hypothetical protein [bacterium]